MAKGGQWERDIAKFLSLWWSGGKEDDLFWRTHSSGARATQRTKVGKKTKGQYGDLCAVDSRGIRLLQVFTISLKRGYTGKTFQDLIDSMGKFDKDGAKPEQEYAGWIREAICADRNAQSLSWLILLRRDKRQALVLVPNRFKLYLSGQEQKKLIDIRPQMSMIVWVHRYPNLDAKQKKRMTLKEKLKYNRANKRTAVSILGYPLDKFLQVVTKPTLIRIAKSNQS